MNLHRLGAAVISAYSDLIAESEAFVVNQGTPRPDDPSAFCQRYINTLSAATVASAAFAAATSKLKTERPLDDAEIRLGEDVSTIIKAAIAANGTLIEKQQTELSEISRRISQLTAGKKAVGEYAIHAGNAI